jgi:hypothetical protein
MVSVVLALALSVTVASAGAAPPLPSREWPVAYVVLVAPPGDNFDVYDVRSEMREPPQYSETGKHSVFGIKRHVGFAGGYDQGIVHGSVGFYVTVAELGRWNFGAPSPAIGFGRYNVYDARQKRYMAQLQSTILVSLASVHYRGGYLRSIGKVWYVHFEQIFDSRANLNGSQFGISFANK